MLNIYQAYDKSIVLIRAGEQVEAAIFHALQFDIDYPHDAQAMLVFWHQNRVQPFADCAGYPK